MTRAVATPQQRRAQRKLAAIGRGIFLGLDKVAGVVLVDVHEHKARDDEWLPAACVVVEVWGGKRSAVADAVEANRPINLIVVPMLRPATRWARSRAWWRWIHDRYIVRRWG